MTNPNAPQSLTISQCKPGLRVVLIGGDGDDTFTDVRAFRGKVVSVKAGWVETRFDDGVTRMCRAKVLALDTADVVPMKAKAPATGSEVASFNVAAPQVAMPPTGKKSSPVTKKAPAQASSKPAPVAKVAKPSKPSKPRAAKVEKVGEPCKCSCGELANPGRAFRQGHDARFHGWMRRLADERLKPSEVPAAALKLMNLNKDGVPTTDWDGSPWSL